MRQFYLCLLLCHLGGLVAAQRDTSLWRGGLWLIGTAAGGQFALDRPTAGKASDALLRLPNAAVIVYLPELCYFWNGRWGLFTTAWLGISNQQQTNDFRRQLESAYPDAYVQVKSETKPKNALQQGLLGLMYRHRNQKISWLPAVAIGFTRFETAYGRADVKEKGNHGLKNIRVANSAYASAAHTAFTVDLGCRLLWSVSRRWSLSARAQVYRAWPQVDFTLTEYDQISQLETVETVTYRSGFSAASLGLGLFFRLNRG